VLPVAIIGAIECSTQHGSLGEHDASRPSHAAVRVDATAIRCLGQEGLDMAAAAGGWSGVTRTAAVPTTPWTS